MMTSCHLFTDLFATDPLGGMTLQRDDAVGLKKAWHKLASKLHPDRQRDNPMATQVLAEEVYKALSIAYNKESSRLAMRI